MKILICDDDIKDAIKNKELIESIEKYSEYEVLLTTPNEMRISIDEKLLDCEIVIMDILFDNLDYDGISLSKLLNKNYPQCQIIYITQNLSYASDVYETNHCYFVVKENSKLTLPRAIDKAISQFEDSSKYEILDILSQGQHVFIKQCDILYIARIRRTVEIHTADSTYTTNESLSQLKDLLSSSFVRCHGGYIVNMEKVTSFSSSELVISSDIEIPIGRSYKKEFEINFLKYWSK